MTSTPIASPYRGYLSARAASSSSETAGVVGAALVGDGAGAGVDEVLPKPEGPGAELALARRGVLLRLAPPLWSCARKAIVQRTPAPAPGNVLFFSDMNPGMNIL